MGKQQIYLPTSKIVEEAEKIIGKYVNENA